MRSRPKRLCAEHLFRPRLPSREASCPLAEGGHDLFCFVRGFLLLSAPGRAAFSSLRFRISGPGVFLAFVCLWGYTEGTNNGFQMNFCCLK